MKNLLWSQAGIHSEGSGSIQKAMGRIQTLYLGAFWFSLAPAGAYGVVVRAPNGPGWSIDCGREGPK